MSGVAYGELLFQHDFAPGEKSASFTSKRPAPRCRPSRRRPMRASCRSGSTTSPGKTTSSRTAPTARPWPLRRRPAATRKCCRPAASISGSSGCPIRSSTAGTTSATTTTTWTKGEGIDMYNVGPTRGAGGTGIWDGKAAVQVGTNFKQLENPGQRPGAHRLRAQLRRLGCRRHQGIGGQALHRRRRPLFRPHRKQLHLRRPGQLTAAVGLNKKPSDGARK
jgi:hypothetical protein